MLVFFFFFSVFLGYLGLGREAGWVQRLNVISVVFIRHLT